MKMRAAKYIAVWAGINVPLAMLWAWLGVGAELAFIIGMLQGVISHVALVLLFIDRGHL